jgi:hypothetical protein
MSICTSFLNVNHQVNVISKLKNSKALPFSEVLTKDDLSRHMQNIKYRDRTFSPEVTLWAFLSQAIEDDKSQQAAVSRIVAAAVAHGEKPPSANTSAYSQARSRLSEESLAALVRETEKQIESSTPNEWRWKNKRIKLIDGSTLSMPDTPQNQDVYPQSRSQKAGVGFPLARIVAVIDYITGVVLDLAIGPCRGKQTGEHALLRELLSLFDRYYPSFFLMAALIKQGVSGVFPAHHCRKPDFRRGKRLGKKDHIASWKKPNKPAWMEQSEYDATPDEILVREVATEIKRPGFRTEARVLVTTLLDPVTYSASELACLYCCRWFIELSLRSIKDTMHMGILRGKTPGMVRKEIWVHLLAYNLIRRLMAQAAWVHGKTVATLSFKLTLQITKAFQQAGLLNDNNPEIYEKLLDAINCKQVGNRPDRQEPRRVKRRPKPFPLLQKARGLYANVA